MDIDARELLRRAGLRVTAQRRAILQAFRGDDAEHLSAEEVHARASQAVPELGRGTVYATLAELVELGLIASVGHPEPVRYETNINAHDHFHCRLCLRLFDVHLGGEQLINGDLDGFRIESVTVTAEGVCTECISYQKGLAEGTKRIAHRPLLDERALSKLACARADSPLGDLMLAASSHGIVRLAFRHHADFVELAERAGGHRGPADARRRLIALRASLKDYFDGSEVPFPDIVDWQLVNSLQTEALEGTGRIPYGDSRSYERVRDGLSPHQCGLLMGGNPVPLLIPCHRVSCGGYRPELYVGGPENLKALHSLEGR